MVLITLLLLASPASAEDGSILLLPGKAESDDDRFRLVGTGEDNDLSVAGPKLRKWAKTQPTRHS
jgi:hypothetical protein